MSEQTSAQDYFDNFNFVEEAEERFKLGPLPRDITRATDDDLKPYYEKALYLCRELFEVDLLIRLLLRGRKPSNVEALHSQFKSIANAFVGSERGLVDADDRTFPKLQTVEEMYAKVQARKRVRHRPGEAFLRDDTTYAVVVEVWDRMIGL